MRSSSSRRWRIAAALLVTALATTACAVRGIVPTPTVSTSTVASVPSDPSDTADAANDDATSPIGGSAVASTGPLVDAVAALEGNGYHVGLAAAAMGGQTSLVAGDWAGGEAWSSIKVPLAIAATRAGEGVSLGNGEDRFPYGACASYGTVDAAIMKAITVSDNCAAWQLWEGLGGDGSAAAGDVDQVLRDGGDVTTQVVTSGVGTRLTFGMTVWSLADQATFAAHLPQLAGADPTYADMGLPKGDASAGAGLNVFTGAYTKAGWGDAAPGGAVTRQFGVVPVGDGQCSAVAIGTDRSSDAFATLTAIALAIQANLSSLPTGPCPSGM